MFSRQSIMQSPHNSYELMHLPDELLLIIMKKLKPVDVLYSLVGVNQRLNKVARTAISNSKINLVKTSSTGRICSMEKLELDRFCSYILPQMHHHIKVMILECLSMEHILLSCDYPQLCSLGLVNLDYNDFSNYLSNDSSIARLLKQQITHLFLSFKSDDNTTISTIDLSKNVYAKIFALGEKLNTLDFGKFNFYQRSLSLNSLSLNTCHSSTIQKLDINVSTLDDCLALLDGRLCQLSTFTVTIRHIDHPTLLIDNTVILSNMKCFALNSYGLTSVYDNQIVPLLHRMPNLEMLTLFLKVKNRGRFVDGNHLNNEILIHMPRLNTFTFYIHTMNGISHEVYCQWTEEIQRAFINKRLSQINCWADRFSNGTGICNVFSLPFTMEYMAGITNNFPGGIFPSVYYLSMLDVRPFEHDFFNLIAQAFPSLRILRLTNLKPQIHKQQHWQLDNDNNTNQNSSIIVYPDLCTLMLPNIHIDYIEEFLHDNNTRLPSLIQLLIKYEQLETVTNNFTNNRTRRNCANLKRIHHDEAIVYQKDFYSYFPSL